MNILKFKWKAASMASMRSLMAYKTKDLSNKLASHTHIMWVYSHVIINDAVLQNTVFKYKNNLKYTPRNIYKAKRISQKNF